VTERPAKPRVRAGHSTRTEEDALAVRERVQKLLADQGLEEDPHDLDPDVLRGLASLLAPTPGTTATRGQDRKKSGLRVPRA
jgi:hypothetical protein